MNKCRGHTPYGYAYLDGKLLIDPKEQIVLRKILKLRQAGQTFQAIADELNHHKTLTRSGKPWIKSVIRSIVLRTKGEIK
ncbi:recombinase family protein [Bacteriovorax stolpii]|uniref:recombinase family protein n=1 Tax=Bacteriovorax stolpii TaxID=960 RepID=UPI001158AB07|nr:recombinase family protein [Bacteriovorax stolpii]